MRPYLLDFMLLAFSLAGIACALLWPGLFSLLSPYVIGIVALTQFLNFLPIKLKELFKLNRRQAAEVALWSGCKLIFLPLMLWPLTVSLAPELVPGMFMAAGMAPAVMAPMVAGFLRGDVVRVMQVLFISSAIMPLSLPLLMKLCLGETVEFNLLQLGFLLSVGVMLPSLLAIGLRTTLPQAANFLQRLTPLVGRSLVFFMASALVAPYASAILQDIGASLFLSLAACAAVVFCALVGFTLCLLFNLPPITGVLVLGFSNFGLSAAMASYFLGQEATILAMGFMLPGLLPIPFLRLWAARRVYQPFETL